MNTRITPDLAASLQGRRIKISNPICEPDRYGTIIGRHTDRFGTVIVIEMDDGYLKETEVLTDVGIGFYLLDHDEAQQQAQEECARIGLEKAKSPRDIPDHLARLWYKLHPYATGEMKQAA